MRVYCSGSLSVPLMGAHIWLGSSSVHALVFLLSYSALTRIFMARLCPPIEQNTYMCCVCSVLVSVCVVLTSFVRTLCNCWLSFVTFVVVSIHSFGNRIHCLGLAIQSYNECASIHIYVDGIHAHHRIWIIVLLCNSGLVEILKWQTSE